MQSYMYRLNENLKFKQQQQKITALFPQNQLSDYGPASTDPTPQPGFWRLVRIKVSDPGPLTLPMPL